MQEVKAASSADASNAYRHFHCPGKNAHVNFALDKKSGLVYWYPKTLAAAPALFVTKFNPRLNARCGRTQAPVFNHGAEAQNVSFTLAMDRYLMLFTPGSTAPVMVPRMVLPSMLHGMLLHGYVAVRNPKWISGCTLGIEDMADAAARFDTTGWQARYTQLRFFRALGGTPDVNQIKERLMLPGSALPKWGPGSDTDSRGEAQRMAREAERSFGRTGFVMDGGHVSPVDQTQGGRSVAKLRQFWE